VPLLSVLCRFNVLFQSRTEVMMRVLILALLAVATPVHGDIAVQASDASANPIRKVVNMLQAMEKGGGRGQERDGIV